METCTSEFAFKRSERPRIPGPDNPEPRWSERRLCGSPVPFAIICCANHIRPDVRRGIFRVFKGVCGKGLNLTDRAPGPFRALNAPSTQVERTPPFHVRSSFLRFYCDLTPDTAKSARSQSHIQNGPPAGLIAKSQTPGFGRIGDAGKGGRAKPGQRGKARIGQALKHHSAASIRPWITARGSAVKA